MQNTLRLFGPDNERTRIGSADTEWAVWSSGPDGIHERDHEGRELDLQDALELANSLNATFAELRLRDGGDEFSPVMHAVVLHWGYAWTAETEHAHGVDCGVPQCGPCSFARAFPEVAAKRKAARENTGGAK